MYLSEPMSDGALIFKQFSRLMGVSWSTLWCQVLMKAVWKPLIKGFIQVSLRLCESLRDLLLWRPQEGPWGIGLVESFINAFRNALQSSSCQVAGNTLRFQGLMEALLRLLSGLIQALLQPRGARFVANSIFQLGAPGSQSFMEALSRSYEVLIETAL